VDLNQKEKRQFPRIQINSAIRYQIRGKPATKEAVCENISSSGAGILDNEFIAPKTILMLEINILSSVLPLIGVVRYVKIIPRSGRYYLGVEFIEAEPGDKRFISEYINMRLNKL